MARYYGAIGFADGEVETAPGLWSERIVEHTYRGEVTRNQVRWNQGSEMHDPLRIDNAISVISDPYLERHVSDIRYITWLGSKWKVSSVSIQRPRLIIQIGGLYHEQTTD